MPSTTRRDFLKRGAAAAAAGPFVLRASQARGADNGADSRSGLLQQFKYGDVQLLDGPMVTQFRHQHQLILNLSDDSLLKPFRQLGGMASPGEDLGGWYSPSRLFNPHGDFTGYVPGHCFGQWLSALARAYAITGDAATREKVQRLVKGYAASITPKFYESYNLPGYIYDKVSCGLVDAHQLAGVSDALAVLNRATDTVLPFLPDRVLTRDELAKKTFPNISYTWDELYTLPENFYIAYQRGAGDRYRQLAQRFQQNDTFFDPLAEGRNVLPGLHAYSHVNALSSAMQAYFVDASEKHLRAAQNAFRFVQEQSFATGGWGPNETFQKPGTDDLAKTLESSHASFETPCGAYGHFKITRYLLRATGDSTYGDSMESVLYNTILGARPTEPDGSTFYYSDYNADAVKGFHGNKWPCCAGTFPQITADYGISSYFRGPKGVYVNLYVPSRLTWKQGSAHISLTQETDYPANGNTTLQLKMDRQERFTLSLRVPAWAGKQTTLRVNGKASGVVLRPGTWAELDRSWKDGDRVEFSLDMPLRLVPLDSQHRNLVALVRGPVALFAVAPGSSKFTQEQMLAATPRGGDWVVRGGEADVVMRSFPAIQKEHYRLYQPT